MNRAAAAPVMPDHAPRKRYVHLSIGEVFATREPIVLQTLLGSCVSTCLHDPVGRVAGMNHILLPGDAEFHKFDASARYGIHAMELLITEMMKLGAHRSRMVAKIFGGAHVLAGVSADAGPGHRNLAFVREYLAVEGFRIVREDTGGTWTRIIRLHTDTFEVMVKKVQTAAVRQLLAQEERHRRAAEKEAAAETEVTLFD